MYLIFKNMRIPRSCEECDFMYHNPLYDEDICCPTGECISKHRRRSDCPIYAECVAEYMDSVLPSGRPKWGEWELVDNGNRKSWQCPFCETKLSVVEITDPTSVGYNCCPNCGAHLNPRMYWEKKHG